MKTFYSFIFAVLLSITVFYGGAEAQVQGIKAIPSTDYPTIQSAFDSLNVYGVGSGGVTFNVSAGHTESITAPLILRATGTSSDPIIFQKTGIGNNPLVTRTDAGTYTTSTLSGQGDAVIAIRGSDYVTFDAIDVAASQSGIEYGYYLMKKSVTDGCKNLNIQYCTVTMTKSTSAYVIGIYSSNNDSNSLVSSATGITVTSTGGRHENVKIIGNTVQNVHTGIYLRGFNHTTAPYLFNDTNFVVGQNGAGNTIQNFGGGSATTTYGVYLIYHKSPNVSYNTINNAGGGGTSHGTTLYGIFMSSSSASGDCYYNNNSITLNESGTGLASCITDNTLGTTKTINNNTFSYGAFGSTSTTYMVSANSSTPDVTFSGNLINGTVNKTGVGSFYLYYNFGSPTSGTETITNNTFDSVTVTGTTTLYCIYTNTGTGQNRVYSGNTVSNISSSGTGSVYLHYVLSTNTNQIYNNNAFAVSTGGTIYGLYFSGNTPTVYNNNIYDITTSGATLYGIYDGGTGTTNCYKNQVYNLTSNSASAAVRGFYITTGTANYVYNNFISDLKAPSASSTTAISGMYISGGTYIGLYYNTIYLNASSSGANFGTSGIYASTTPTVDLRNNIVVNASTPAGTGFAIAHQRSSTTLTSYSSLSNNNDFYAGAPSTSNLIYYDGTNAIQDMATYKSLVSPRDGASFRGLPPFINVATTPYDLHISTTTATQTESGGTPVTTPLSITDDYDANTRNVSTPDVGADEFNGIGLDLTGPSIAYSLLTNESSTSNRTFSNVSASDPSGVDYNTGTAPRVYYKKTTDANTWVDGNSSTEDSWKYVETATGSSPFSFTIDYSLLYGAGTVSIGDTIQYFVVAQDLVSPPNVGINSGTFKATPSSVALDATAFPVEGTVNRYVITSTYKDTVLVGTGNTYTTLTDSSGLFRAINNGTISGNLTVLITSDITEPGYFELNQTIEELNYTITIQPSAAVNRTISGNYAGYLIRLNGADRITFDGRYNGSGNYLTFQNTNTGSSTGVFLNNSLGTGLGAVDNTIRNCNIQAGLNTATTYGIRSYGADNDRLKILYNNITKCYYGMYIYGASGGYNDSLEIIGNVIGSNTADDYVRYYGMYIYYLNTSVIEKNEIFNMIGDNSKYGIYAYYTTDNIINKNKIHSFSQSSTTAYYANGIYLGGTISNNLISNNAIYDLNIYGSTTIYYLVGIRLLGGDGNKLYYNSVSLTGPYVNTASGLASICLYVSTASTNIDMRDNIFNNAKTGTSPLSYTVYTVSGTTFSNINYNNYYTAGTTLGVYNGTAYANFAAWIAATGELNSLGSDPQLNSATFLAPNIGSPVVAAGTPISGITTDIIDSLRNVSTPTMGAYEVAVDGSGPAITYTPLGNGSSLTSRTFTAVITDVSGVNTTSGTMPRVYYKKYSDANTFNDNTNATDGWKWTEATNSSSPFSFTMNYSLIYGGTVSLNDTIQYFVVAQDLQATPYVSINSGTFASPPSSVNLTAAAFPIGGTINKYEIKQGVAGPVIYVGTGQTYTTLTDSTGLFAAINNGLVGSDLTVYITSDIWEPGYIALNQTNEELNYNIRIVPDAATLRTIAGSYAGGLIRLNGADRITFDGSFNGSGQYLLFRNRYSSTSYTLHFGNDASNDTVKNCIVQGAYNPIYFAAGTSTLGNLNNVFDNVDVRDADSLNLRPTYGFYIYGAYTKYTKIMNSKIHNVSSYGVYHYGGGGYTDSNFTFVNNDIYRFGSYGLYMYYWSGTNNLIEGNRIYQDTANYTGSSNYGIVIYYNNAGSTITIRNNRIYNLAGTASATLKGMYIYSSSVTDYMYIYNNVISLGESTTTTGQIDGIDYYAYAANNCYVFYNSIYINGTQTSSANSNGINKRDAVNDWVVADNTIQNARTNSTGTGKHYAYNYANTSTVNWIQNYNDFFVNGSGGVLTLYYTTDYATLTDWQTNSGKDTNSLNADPMYNLLTTYDLQPQTGSPLYAAGYPVPGITKDILDTLRSATTPTIGAFEKLTPDTKGPTIAYTPLINLTSTSNRVLTDFATITDPSGVSNTTGTAPRIYYKKSTDTNDYLGNTSSFAGWKWTEATDAASPFDFTIDYSLLYPSGTVSTGDVIQYFIVAQDTLQNVGIKSGTFAAQPTSVNLTSAAFPIGGTIYSYNIGQSYAGSYNVGTGQTYTTLTASDGLFNAINSGIVTGNVIANITSDITEPGTVALNQTVEELNYTVRIQPSDGSMKTLTGSYVGGLIRLNGADRITIDGSYNGSGQYLTIQNTSTSSLTAAIMLISLGNGLGCENDTIKNCIIKAGTAGTGSTYTYGIYMDGASISSTPSAGADHKYNVIANNTISRAYCGIGASGSSARPMLGIKIVHNAIGSSATAEYNGRYGMYLAYSDSMLVSKNFVFNQVGTTTTPVGIQLYSGVKNSVISKNNVHTIKYTSTAGYGGRGIYVYGDTNIYIVNNAVYDIGGDGYSSFSNSSPVGIYVDGVSDKLQIYYNSVNMFGDLTYSSATLTAAMLFYTSTITNVDLRDNVFSNSMNNTVSTTAKNYAIYSAAANTAFTNINYNDYYVTGTQGVLGFIGGVDVTTLAAWRLATLQDSASIDLVPGFNSNMNLAPMVSSALLNAGTPISGVTEDILDTLRSVTTPTIGAYEKGVDLAAPVITYTPISNTTSTSNPVLTGFATITDVGAGLDTATGNRTRIYYKKSTNANAFGGNTSSTDGWKWVEASNNASPFDYTIDYTLLYPDGVVTSGTVVQYFVVAQDLASPVNVASNPAEGFVATSVSSITSAPTSPNYYVIIGTGPLAGDYTVGLAKFNEITGLNLYMEKQTRKVMKKVLSPDYNNDNTVDNLAGKNTSESIEEIQTDGKSGEKQKDIFINDRSKEKDIFGNNPNGKNNSRNNVNNEQSRFKTVEVDEEYYVIMQDGKPYTGPLYVDLRTKNTNSRSINNNNLRTAEPKKENTRGIVETSNTRGIKDSPDLVGAYATITAAIADLNARGVSDQVRFLLTDATYPYEAYPLVVDSVVGVNDTNTVTIKPNTGVTTTITGSNSYALFDLSNCKYFIFDGSNTLNGTSKDMTIINTNVYGANIMLENDSKYNLIKNTILKSGTLDGIILFYTTTGTDGNDFNTVTNCDITNISGTEIPYAGIMSYGTTTALNSDNYIYGNNIYNINYSGIFLTTGSGDGWIIKNNSFYRTLTSEATSVHAEIQIAATTSNADSILNNYIGGSAPNCGGSYWTDPSKQTMYGIYVVVGSTAKTIVKGNTIQNIALTNPDTTGLSGGYIYAIYQASGSGAVDIYNNTVGHATTSNSVTSAGTGGIRAITTYGPVNVKFNLLANITCTSPAYDSISNFYGVQLYYDMQDTVAYNRIYNIGETNPNARTSYIPAGIMLRHGQTTLVNAYIVYNNMISMGCNSSNELSHTGIWDYYNYTRAYIYDNSIYINGSAALVGSYGFYKQSASTTGAGTTLINNTIFNNRTRTSAYGAFEWAFYFVSYTGVVSDYNNLYSSTDTCIYYSGAKPFTSYVTTSGFDKQSLSGNPAYTSESNLLPDNTNENSWNVNGKGTQTWINDDFLGNLRSTTVPNGPTDFGAYEFTPTVAPPTMIQTGTIGVGNTTSYAQSLKTYLDITWGASADNTRGITRETVSNVRGNNNLRTSPQRITDYPATVMVKKYSGIDPPDVTGIPSPQMSKGYWYVDTDADPGSPVTVKVHWGYEELGNISDTSKLILAMYDMKNRAWVPFYRGTGDGYSVVDHANKTITVSGLTRLDSVCYALTSSDAPLKRFVLDLTLLIEGLYYDGGNPPNMVPDTVTAELRQPGTYTLIETMTIPLDQYGKGYGYTASMLAVTDNLFWIAIKHRNALETWCDTTAVKPMFSRLTGTAVYDFTSAQSQAFGSNMVLKNSKWCLYSGDIYKDGFIDGTDMALLDIDLYNYAGGWIPTDLTGDQFVDGSDMAIVDINLYNYIGSIKPDGAPGYMKILRPKRQQNKMNLDVNVQRNSNNVNNKQK